MENIIKRCPMCGKACVMRVTNAQYDKYVHYNNNSQVLVQDVFPELNETEREYIKTGHCPSCQTSLFGDGVTDNIKDLWCDTRERTTE